MAHSLNQRGHAIINPVNKEDPIMTKNQDPITEFQGEFRFLPMEAAGELARNIWSARLVAEVGAMKGGSIHREQKDTC